METREAPTELKMAIWAAVAVYFSNDYGPVAEMDLSGKEDDRDGYLLRWAWLDNHGEQLVSGINEAIELLKGQLGETITDVSPVTYFSVNFRDDHGLVASMGVDGEHPRAHGQNLVWKKYGKRDSRKVSGIVEAIKVVEELFDATVCDDTGRASR